MKLMNIRMLLCLLFLSFPALSQTLTVVSFNVESGGANINTLSSQVGAMEGVDLWGFSEVLDEWQTPLTQASAQGEGGQFESILGTTGRADRLMIVYDDNQLDLLEHDELRDININGRVRAPLVARFRHVESNREFWFMVNHLYRSNASARHTQARMINDWAEQQTIPVIAVGDYNFDWSVTEGENRHDTGYDNLVEDGVFTWVRPTLLMRTHCSSRDGVLDFVFVAGDARQWQATSEILPMRQDYCVNYRRNDDDSDHRPVRAEFNLTAGSTGNTQAQLLQQIRSRLTMIEQEVVEIRSVVQQLEQ